MWYRTVPRGKNPSLRLLCVCVYYTVRHYHYFQLFYLFVLLSVLLPHHDRPVGDESTLPEHRPRLTSYSQGSFLLQSLSSVSHLKPKIRRQYFTNSLFTLLNYIQKFRCKGVKTPFTWHHPMPTTIPLGNPRKTRLSPLSTTPTLLTVDIFTTLQHSKTYIKL